MSILEGIIETQKADRPLITIHGGPGSWKTQFGLDCPSPLFIALEDGFGNRAHKAARPKSTAEMYEIFKELITPGHGYKTVVIDSLDHLAPLIVKEICEEGGKNALGDFGFGKGYELEAQQWLRLFKGLTRLRDSGLFVVCICHSQVRPIDDPNMSAPYDRIEPKLPKKANAIVKELSDILGASIPDMTVITDEKTQKTKAVGSGKFKLHLSPTPAIEAKNRYRMASSIPFTFTDFANEWSRVNAHINNTVSKGNTP